MGSNSIGDSNSAEIRIEEVELADNRATRSNQIAPTQVNAAALSQRPRAPNFASRLAKLLFFAHLVVIIILITFLSIRGFISRHTDFRPKHWFGPLLTSAVASALISLLWLLLTLHHPRKTLKASLWLSPSLSCGAGVLLVADGTGFSLAFAVPFLVFAVAQSLYACWITPRLFHAGQILSDSVATVKPSLRLAKYISIAVLSSLFYSSVWTLGVGGIAADNFRFAPLFVLLLLLSLAWTMQTIRYMIHVSIARLAYMKLAYGMDVDVREAFSASVKRLFGNICYGAAVVPVVVVTRGMARAMFLIVGDSDEFLFSCASCYMGIADRLITLANLWGFVLVGVFEKGLQTASAEAWEMFRKRGMEKLINLDVTGSFCLMCGVAGGAASALICGSWVLSVDKRHVTEATIYAFIVGYFMTRIVMGWAQSCVAAYHVAYAMNPQNNQFGSCISDRIRELQFSPD